MLNNNENCIHCAKVLTNDETFLRLFKCPRGRMMSDGFSIDYFWLSTQAMSDVTKKQRTSNEKLRSDHIDMLNMLQKFQDENEQLKAQVTSLKRQLGITDSTKESTEEDNEPQMSATQLLAETHFLKDELKKLKESMKKQETEITKKVTGNMNKTIEDLTKQIYKFQKEGKDSQDQIKQLESKLNDLTIQLNDASSKVTTIAAPCTTCSTHQQLTDTLQTQLQQLRQENEQLQTQIAHTQSSSTLTAEDYQRAQTKLITLEKQCLSINQQYLLSCEQASSLHAHIHRLELHIKNQEHEKLKMQESIEAFEKQVQAMKDIALATNTPSFASPTPSHHSLPRGSTSKSSRLMTILPTEDIDDTKSIISVTSLTQEEEELLSFRFQDYLRLKRENKELKIRIAEMTSHSNHSSSSHNSSSTRTSTSHRSPATSTRMSTTSDTGLPSAGSGQISSRITTATSGNSNRTSIGSTGMEVNNTLTNTNTSIATNSSTSINSSASTSASAKNNTNKLGKSLSLLQLRR